MKVDTEQVAVIERNFGAAKNAGKNDLFEQAAWLTPYQARLSHEPLAPCLVYCFLYNLLFIILALRHIIFRSPGWTSCVMRCLNATSFTTSGSQGYG